MNHKEPIVERFWQKVWTNCNGLKSPRWIYLLPLILFSPSLFFGLVADDYLHYWMFHEGFEGKPLEAIRSLFVFLPTPIPGLLDAMPWWLDEGFKMGFFRPVTALTHWLDAALWPDAFFLHHLHSLIWACLSVWVVHRLFKRTMGPGWPAVLCALLFAVQDSHAIANGWLAQRNSNVAFVFGMLAVDYHIRNRTENRGLLLPTSLMAISLLSAEAGLCAMALIGSWALFYEKRIKTAVWSLTPYVILIGAWQFMYRAMGFGTNKLTLYVDPGTQPLLFMERILVGVPLMLTNQLYKFPSEVALGLSGFMTIFVVVSCLLSLLLPCVFFARTITNHKQLKFWALSMVVALFPVSAAVPMERLLLFCGVGFVGLLVGLLQHYPGRLAKWFLFLHLPVAIVMCPLKSMTVKIQDLFKIGYHSLPKDRSGTSHVFFLNGIEFSPIYAKVIPLIKDEMPLNGVSLLSPAPNATITRIDENSFEMSLPGGWFERGTFATTPQQTFEVGDKHASKEYLVEVMSVTLDGQPTVIRYQTKKRLSHPDYHWMIWRGLHYEEIEIDFEIGEPVFFPEPTLDDLMNDH